MKPGFIFSAVFIMAVAMALGLPQLSAVPPVHAAEINNAAGGAPELSVQTEQGLELGAAHRTAPQAGDQTGSLVVNQADRSTSSVPSGGIALTSASPDLQNFAAALINHQAGQVVGVYAAGLFALPIIQQPAKDFNFIAAYDGVLTQYAPPADYGTLSLLAHNYLAGRVFFYMSVGQQITLVYGDGRLVQYRVDALDVYQALSPSDPYSDFINQSDPSAAVQNFQQVYDRYYKVNGQLVFQTCVERDGDLSWGRLFIVAHPE